MSLLIDAACGSQIGRVRGNNEDNFLFAGTCMPSDNRGQPDPLTFCEPAEHDLCFAVFDGMGGGEFGEIASYTAADLLRTLCDSDPHPADIRAFLESASDQMNRSVYGEAAAREVWQMGSTEAILYLRGSQIVVCNIGDSRIFGLRDGRFIQISCDHSDEAYMQQQGITGRKPRLTQFLGMNPEEIRIEPHIVSDTVRAGDIYLICSDGLTDMVGNEQIKEILETAGMAEPCVRQLTEAALDGGGKDNVTIAVIRILGSGGEASEEPAAPVSEKPEEAPAESFLHKLMGLFGGNKHE